MKLLEVKNLKKYYPQKEGFFRKHTSYVNAVDDISFSLEEKKTLAIVGESGSGKTTAALSAICLTEPTSGQITFMGKDLIHASSSEKLFFRQKIQIIFQDPLTSLNPRKTILESLGEPLLYHGIVKCHKEKEEYVSSILEKVGISKDRRNQYPHQFSGGERQRISIGRAIAMRPKLIVCDEAISALDLSNQAKILNLLFSLKQDFDLSYLFISHDLSTVRHFSDEILVMYRGKIVERGETSEVFDNQKHPYTQLLFSSLPKKHPKDQTAVKPSLLEQNVVSYGCPFFSKCPVAKSDCQFHLPPWKDETKTHGYHCIY